MHFGCLDYVFKGSDIAYWPEQCSLYKSFDKLEVLKAMDVDEIIIGHIVDVLCISFEQFPYFHVNLCNIVDYIGLCSNVKSFCL